MRSIAYRCLVGLTVSAMVGCNSPLEESPFRGWVDHDPSTWRVSDGASEHSRQTLLTSVAPAAAAEVPADAGAEDYVRLALARNPSLRAAEEKVRRLTQRIPQVTSLDDPMFMTSPVGEMAETAEGMVGLMTTLSQKLPTPGKLKTRGRIAGQEVAMAAQEFESTRLGVIADTRRAYWSYYFTARGIEVIEADRRLLSDFRQEAEAKYKAGTATQQDVLRASVELSDLDNRLITIRQRQTTAVAMLNSLLDLPVNAALPQPRRVELDRIDTSLDRLLAEAAQANPELRKVRERIEMYRQKRRLAKLERWPDLTVGVTYNAVEDEGTSMAATGKDQWWLSLGFNLPIWVERRDAAEREAMHGIFEGVADLTNQSNRVAFRVQDAFVRVDTQQRLVVLFRDVIIPQARQTVDASAGGYRAGRVDFLTFVDNWRKLLDFELMYHQSLSQLEQNFAELQQTVGRDLSRVAVEPTRQTTEQPEPPAHE